MLSEQSETLFASRASETMLRSRTFCLIAIFVLIMTIDVCEAKGGGRARPAAPSRGGNYYGAGGEGKEFYTQYGPIKNSRIKNQPSDFGKK